MGIPYRARMTRAGVIRVAGTSMEGEAGGVVEFWYSRGGKGTRRTGRRAATGYEDSVVAFLEVSIASMSIA